VDVHRSLRFMPAAVSELKGKKGRIDSRLEMALVSFMRQFFTGPMIKTELMVVWLEKHGITATMAFVDPELPDDGDLSREAVVSVSEADYDRAYQIFYTDREDEF